MQTANTNRRRKEPGSAGLLLLWLLICSTAGCAGTSSTERGVAAPRDHSFNWAPHTGSANAFIVLGDDARIITSSDGLSWMCEESTGTGGTQRHSRRLA